MKVIFRILILALTISCSENSQKRLILERSPASNLSPDSILVEYQRKFKIEGKVNLGEMAKKMYIADSTNPEFAVRYATCMLANAHFEDAKYMCRKAISLDSNYSGAYWNLGMAHMMINRDSGYYYFNKAIRKNPNWYYYFWLSKYHEEDSMYVEALADINKAINKRPNDLDLILFRGKYKNHNGDYLGALQDLKIIPDHRKSDPDIYNALAFSYLKLEKFEKAIQYCDTGLRINPNHVYLLFIRAAAETNVDRSYEALEDLRKCVELGYPECEEYYQKLKESLEKIKHS